MWVTVAKARQLLKLSQEEVNDSALEEYIAMAQKVVRGDTGLIISEEASVIDVNKLQVTPPIGDRDFDGVVTPNDVTVYCWYGATEDSKEELEVSAVYPKTGLIITAENLPTGKIVVEYVQSWIEEDSTVLALATALATGYIYSCNAYFAPPTFRMGAITISYRVGGGRSIRSTVAYPPQLFWQQYQQVISPYRRKVMEVLELKTLTPLEEGKL